MSCTAQRICTLHQIVPRVLHVYLTTKASMFSRKPKLHSDTAAGVITQKADGQLAALRARHT